MIKTKQQKCDIEEEEDGAALQKYCNDINQFDLKFMYYRLLNNGVFVVGCCFYVAMDILPYSGLEVLTGRVNNSTTGAADDDAVGTSASEQAWINRYAILYFVAACLFVVTGIIDLYLVKLGSQRTPHEVEQQIINRVQARVRATSNRRQRRRRTTTTNTMTTMMGFMINIPNVDDHPDDDNYDTIYHHENNSGMVVVEENDTTIAEDDHTNHVMIEKIKDWCGCYCCTTTSSSSWSLPSTVVLVSWSLLIGGVFGVGSSVLIVHNLITSDILNAISVHLFFIQACTMYYARFSGWRKNKSTTTPNDDDNDSHRVSGGHTTTDDAMICREQQQQQQQQQQHSENDTDANDKDANDEDTAALRMDTVLEWWYILGDTAFGLGALIDVIVSYVYLLSTAYFVQGIVTILSGILWWVSSILYGLATLYDYHRLRQDIRDEAKEIDDIITTTTTTTQNASNSSSRTSNVSLM